MNKILKKLICIILLVAFLIAILTACKKGRAIESPVEKIEILQGSFKSQYALDEQLDLSNAKIKVFYLSGETEEKSITIDMIAGFDTRTNLPATKTLEVVYRGVSTTFTYEVLGETHVTSPIRLVIEEAPDPEKGAGYCCLNLYILHADEVTNGIYALMFDVEKASELSIAVTTVVLSQRISAKWTTTPYENTENPNKFSILAYAKNGQDALLTTIDEGESTQKILLYSIRIKKPSSASTIHLKNITISDGTKDTKAPNLTFVVSAPN